MIWGLHLAKVTQPEIARRAGCSVRTVRRIVAACVKNGFEEGVKEHRKGVVGRKTLFTPKVLNALRRWVHDHPFTTAVQVKRSVPEVAHLSVRRICEGFQKKLGMPIRRAAPKPLLNERMVAQRLEFCRSHLHWTPDDWNKVMFSDESTFLLLRNRMKLVRRPVGQRYNPKFTSVTVKHCPSVMVWGAFSGRRGRAGIFFLPPNVKMNGERYIGVLNEHLLGFMQRHQCTHFLHDGAPCHRARLVINWLRDHDIRTIDWPGNSPDLNPIENAWNIMKNQLAEYRPSNKADMIAKIKQVWVRQMTPDYFRRLAEGMPRRLAAVIANNGWMTKY